MKYIGIDYGTKRVGVAVSDDGGTMAFPMEVLKHNREGADDADADIKGLALQIEEIARKKEAPTIVLGESTNAKGEDNAAMEHIHALKAELEGRGFIVEMEPEYFTSVQGARVMGEDGLLDARAAALILQSFLDRKPK